MPERPWPRPAVPEDSLPIAERDRKTMDGTQAPWEARMAAAMAGDGRVYEGLLRDILPLLRGIARRRIRDAAEAEDAVQDTLLTVHRLRHSYDPTRPLRPWLVALCERRCIDRLRARGRITARQTALEECDEAALAHAPCAEAAVAAAELRTAIAALPPTQRQALTLAKLQDLPLAEAAALSGLSIGALKVATHRAVRTLRKRLGVVLEEGGLDAGAPA